MQIKQQVIEKGLENKGFERSNSDHNYFTYWSKAGKKTNVFTKTSHGGRDIGDSLIAKMAKQCKLTKSEFLRLVECPLSRDDYEKFLATQNISLT